MPDACPHQKTCVPPEPVSDCGLCPRLVAFRQGSVRANPNWYNGAVRSFGSENAQLLIVGLAPGLKGANRTGRPFTGDYAGDLLYETLAAFGWSSGTYGGRPDDGLTLNGCMITNAVRCVPPQNKPTGAEIKTCGAHLGSRIAALPNLRVILALGRIAHDAVVTAHGAKKAAFRFAHRARHELPGNRVLFDSFHCSRYNTNTGRLTPDMFNAVFADIGAQLRSD